jgi:hypothetical protein
MHEWKPGAHAPSNISRSSWPTSRGLSRGSHFFVTLKAGEKVDKHRLTQVGRAMKELGVQMIAAYSPQARGRSERSFRNVAGAVAAGTTAGRDHQRGGGQCLSAGAVHRGVQPQVHGGRGGEGTAFRRTSRSDLNWIFTVQTKRVVDKDNTVAIGNRSWQIDKTRFRSTLARSTVTIHEHLDETVSIRFGPHVVGRYDRDGEKLRPASAPERRGKGGSMEAGENQRRVSTGSHTPLGISPKAGDSHFPTAPTTAVALPKRKAKANTKTPKAAA